MEIPTKADVPDMLRAAWELASTMGPLAPAVLRSEDVAVIAAHIGAAEFRRRPHDGGFSFKCPACGEWDFGPTEDLRTAVNIWLRGGYLPTGPLLGGACLGCEHITSPAAVDATGEDREEFEALLDSSSLGSPRVVAVRELVPSDVLTQLREAVAGRGETPGEG